MKEIIFAIAVTLIVGYFMIPQRSGLELGDQLVAQESFLVTTDFNANSITKPKCFINANEVVRVSDFSSIGSGPLVQLSTAHCSGWRGDNSELKHLLGK